ncbi:MAG: phage tail tape measure protein, partial [Candidatus Thorarchaeota archaeon]
MPEFTIQVKVDSTGAVRSVKRIETQLKRTEKQAKKTQSVLKKAFAGVAVGQGAMQATRFLANFAQEMSTVKAITNATGQEFDAMRKKAIDLGTTTRFTSQQAASGMLFLARSGFEVNEILEAIPGTLNLAQAGALGLGRAADIATNILKGFGLATSETNRVVDVLALAANSANTTVEQLGQAMKFVAPIASGVRMSLEDTAAAIQVLSNAGIQASMAGTGLRRVIGALEGPTTAQEKVLNNLGLSIDEVKVSSVGLSGALAKIRSRTNDVGTALKLFGQRGGPAAVVMANLWEEMDKFGTANLDAAGTATRIAKVMDDNLNGAILRVKSAFQGLLILLGDVSAVSALRTILESIANTFRF